MLGPPFLNKLQCILSYAFIHYFPFPSFMLYEVRNLTIYTKTWCYMINGIQHYRLKSIFFLKYIFLVIVIGANGSHMSHVIKCVVAFKKGVYCYVLSNISLSFWTFMFQAWVDDVDIYMGSTFKIRSCRDDEVCLKHVIQLPTISNDPLWLCCLDISYPDIYKVFYTD